ncbi:MAG: DUF167 family protein [Hyphomicrobiaceae bacterium]
MRPRADLWRRGKSGIELNARVIPRSSKDVVECVEETAKGLALRVRVRAVPDRGEANRSVERALADWLGVPRTSVTVIAGTASRAKRIGIAGSPETIEALIRDRLSELQRPETSLPIRTGPAAGRRSPR